MMIEMTKTMEALQICVSDDEYGNEHIKGIEDNALACNVTLHSLRVVGCKNEHTRHLSSRKEWFKVVNVTIEGDDASINKFKKLLDKGRVTI
jgi:hypothetical protein